MKKKLTFSLVKEIFLASEKDILLKFEQALSGGEQSELQALNNKGIIATDYDNFLLWIPNKIKVKALLMAHIDRVIAPEVIVNTSNIIVGSPGLGADDRAGVLTLWLLQDLGAPLLLTNYEESGGTGAQEFLRYLEANSDIADTLRDLNVIVAFDRQGYNHFVRYSYQENKIPEIMEKFGFEEQAGSWSDCLELAEYLQIAEVNISVGYYKQHTKEEYWDLRRYKSMLKQYPKIIKALAKEKCSIAEWHDTWNTATYCPYCGERYSLEWLENEQFKVKGHTLVECPWCFKMVDVTEEVDECGYCDYSYSYYF